MNADFQTMLARQLRRGRRHNVLDCAEGDGEIAIYALSDPRDVQQYRYIGQTRSPFSRYAQHVRAARLWLPDETPWWIRREELRPLYAWIRELHRDEARLPMMCIVAWSEAEQALRAERDWIGACLAQQLPLLNRDAMRRVAARARARARPTAPSR